MAGLLAGTAALATAATPPGSGQQTIRQMSANASNASVRIAAGAKVLHLDGGTHDCKGQNDCKGQGGCKTSDQGCKGQNSCKGKGGCKTNAASQPSFLH